MPCITLVGPHAPTRALGVPANSNCHFFGSDVNPIPRVALYTQS